MAQYTVQLDPAFGTQGELRVCRRRTRETVTFTIRNGETIVTDDPDFIAALNSLLGRAQPVLATRAVRPASPTHDVDRKAVDAAAVERVR